MNKPAEEPTDQYIRGASIMAVVHNVIIRSLNTIYLQAHHVRPEDVKDFLGYCYCWYQYLDCELCFMNIPFPNNPKINQVIVWVKKDFSSPKSKKFAERKV